MSRLLVAALASMAIGNACSSDSAAPAAPITFGIGVSLLDGHPVDEPVELRCDHGGPGAATATEAFSTLAVTVALTPLEAGRNFVLSPANACGSSKRCGFVRIAALDATGGVLAHADTVTTEGVLKLAVEQLPDLTQVKVSLIRGLDQQPLQNPDKTEVNHIVTPTFVVPSDCALPPSGGAGGDSSSSTLGGAGGDSSSPAQAGADGNLAGAAAGGIGGA